MFSESELERLLYFPEADASPHKKQTLRKWQDEPTQSVRERFDRHQQPTEEIQSLRLTGTLR